MLPPLGLAAPPPAPFEVDGGTPPCPLDNWPDPADSSPVALHAAAMTIAMIPTPRRLIGTPPQNDLDKARTIPRLLRRRGWQRSFVQIRARPPGVRPRRCHRWSSRARKLAPVADGRRTQPIREDDRPLRGTSILREGCNSPSHNPECVALYGMRVCYLMVTLECLSITLFTVSCSRDVEPENGFVVTPPTTASAGAGGART